MGQYPDGLRWAVSNDLLGVSVVYLCVSWLFACCGPIAFPGLGGPVILVGPVCAWARMLGACFAHAVTPAAHGCIGLVRAGGFYGPRGPLLYDLLVVLLVVDCGPLTMSAYGGPVVLVPVVVQP